MNKRILNVPKRFPKRSRTEARASLKSSNCWPVLELFDFYVAGARKAGLSIEYVARQFEAECDTLTLCS